MNSMARAARGGVVAVLTTLVVAACGGDVERDDDGELLEPTDIDVFELRVGDCLDGFAEGDEISQVRAVPCSESHSDEVFASAEMTGGDEYPGDEAVAEFADETCLAEFEEFVGTSWEESELDYGFLAPTESSWSEGDREVLCIVGDPGSDVTGSLQDAQR